MAVDCPSPAERLIRERLAQAGRLTFAEFMELALYAPAVGYYATQAVLGEAGDYVTSPELHPAFGALLGWQLEDCWLALGSPARFQVREVGAGRGVLGRDLLLWARAAAPAFADSLVYEIVERSPALRARQQETLEQAGLGAAAVRWLDPPAPGSAGGVDTAFAEPGQGSVIGCVLSNELVDSFPVHLVVIRDSRLRELYVVWTEDGFSLVEDALSSPALAEYFERLALWPAEGCRAEVNLQAVEWMAEVAAQLERGLVLTLDYGYPADLLYAPHRRAGTLLCYYRHTLGSNPLERVGRQDITAHVDFTTLAETGERHGLQTIGFVSQARLLTNLGLPAYAERLDELAGLDRAANRRALQALSDPDGLGRIGALFQQRGLEGYRPVGLSADAPLPSSAYLPLLAPASLRLPAAADLDGLGDFIPLWQAFVTGDESILDGDNHSS